MVSLFAMAAAALLAPAPAADSKPIVVTGTKPNPDEVICEKVRPPGSRLVTKRICQTRAQWAQYVEESRTYAVDLSRSALLWNAPPH